MLESSREVVSANSNVGLPLLGHIYVSPGLKQLIVENNIEFCAKVRKVDAAQSVEFILSKDYLQSQADFYLSIFKRFGISPQKARILEVGSGYGFFLAYARRALGWNIFGIEPGINEFNGRFKIAQELLLNNGIEPSRLIDSTGENIKIESNSFDVVLSNDVLEHVGNPLQVLRESSRILKPNGLLVFNIPNYRWIYEGHYNIFWLPFLTKGLAKKYVRFWKRDPYYLEHLNFITPTVVKKMIKELKEIKLCFPLDHQSSDFVPKRIKAYIESSSIGKQGGFLRMAALRALYAISCNLLFKVFMSFVAKTSGVFHEIHIVAKKLK